MTFDPQTIATLVSFIVSFVGIVKFLVPAGTNQNNEVRLLSALTGAAVFASFALTHTTFPSVGAGLKLAFDAAGQGFVAGSFATAGVKGVHLAQSAVGSLRRAAPAEPAAVATPAAAEAPTAQ